MSQRSLNKAEFTGPLLALQPNKFHKPGKISHSSFIDTVMTIQLVDLQNTFAMAQHVSKYVTTKWERVKFWKRMIGNTYPYYESIRNGTTPPMSRKNIKAELIVFLVPLLQLRCDFGLNNFEWIQSQFS